MRTLCDCRGRWEPAAGGAWGPWIWVQPPPCQGNLNQRSHPEIRGFETGVGVQVAPRGHFNFVLFADPPPKKKKEKVTLMIQEKEVDLFR